MTEESSQPQKNSMTRFMQPAQVLMIDEARASTGEDGEARLVVEKGR